jgi:hypothetical protein
VTTTYTVSQRLVFTFPASADPQAALAAAIEASGQNDFERVVINDQPDCVVIELVFRQRANVVPLVLHSAGRHGADAIVTKGAE